MRYLQIFAIVLALLTSASVEGASVSRVAYVANGTVAQNAENNLAMNTALGAGQWTRLTLANTASFANFDALVIDSNRTTRAAFTTFLNTNRVLLQNFVANGGRLLINVAYRSAANFVINLGFGATLRPNIGTSIVAGQVTANGFQVDATNATDPIIAGPAGNAGTTFTSRVTAARPRSNPSNLASSDFIIPTNATATTLLTIAGTGQAALVEQRWGSGIVWLGSLANAANIITPTVNGRRLRANLFAAVAAPEPAEWALLISGIVALGVIGWRRRTLPLLNV